MQFTITSEYAKVRLDKFLTEHFPDFSRAHLQKLVKDGQVTVNEKRVTPHHFLKTGDKVAATIGPIAELRVIPNPEVKLSILHEEPDFIIINKPAGMVVHQAEGHKAPDTLANGLLARYPEIGKVGDDPVRPGIMHRLDADVSGVMVIARTQDMFDHLKQQFKVHAVEKEYVAVVQGKVSPPSGTIEFAIARKGAKMVARPKGAEGKMAVTEYTVLQEIKRLSDEATKKSTETPLLNRSIAQSLLQITTRTGRTHQIRVHLKAKGWPIMGDRLYGGARGQVLGISRLLLHARKIVFTDLTGKKREFTIEPPFV